MRFLASLAWRDLRAGGRPLWVFAACLLLGVALVAAGGALYRQVGDTLRDDVRALFGGDLEVTHGRPLEADALAWMRERSAVSVLLQLRTMLLTSEGRSQLVELQSADGHYPLYGRMQLSPALSLAEALGPRDGRYGVALDAVLARRLALSPGDEVQIGAARFAVRALVLHQPDRSLRAEWRGPPVMVSDAGLAASGLVQAGSRMQYRYRVRTAESPGTWRTAFMAAFPASSAEIRSVEERSERLTEVLGQVGSGLLLVGFSTLFIGGLGVFNSVQAFLNGKLGTLATLRALGLRDARLAAFVLLQILMLAIGASLAGALAGALLALGGMQLVREQLPLAFSAASMAVPLAVSVAFGVLTALAFAAPALGRALAVNPAALFRGLDGGALRTPAGAWMLSGLVAAVLLALLLAVLPDARFGLGFVGVCALLLGLLEVLLRVMRHVAARVLASSRWPLGFEARVALAALHRPASPMRTALLSLGSALTLLVACTLVIASLLRTVNETVPAQAPGLVFHDVQSDQLATLDEVLRTAPSLRSVRTAPLVLGRLVAVNGERLEESADEARRSESRDEHKFSHRQGNFDDVVVTRGAWWPEQHRGRPLVAMEDREADQLGLRVGDRLRFEIADTVVEAELVAIYAQRRFQARLWLEAIFSDGVLDPFITRHVGAAYLSPEDAIVVQDRLAAAAPNVVSVRTEALLETSRSLMARASGGLAVIALACLLASLLVLASVAAASRARQVYEASVMHALGARMASLRRVLRWEHGLLAVATAAFAIAVGSGLAVALLRLRLDLDADGLYWTGVATALGVSLASLGIGAQILLAQMRVAPARLLRSGA